MGKKKYPAHWTVLGTPEEYIEFFDAIPKREWTTGTLKDKETGCKCALGHLGLDYQQGDSSLDDHPVNGLLGVSLFAINDESQKSFGGNEKFYQLGKHPKERVINALTLKAAGLWDLARGVA